MPEIVHCESTTGHEVDPQGVNHPKHYNIHPSGIECIDVIEHMTHNIGASIKYLWRAGLKPGESDDKDIRKAIWYLERELDRRARLASDTATGHPAPATDLLRPLPIRTHPSI
jgi:hypothetical protein